MKNMKHTTNTDDKKMSTHLFVVHTTYQVRQKVIFYNYLPFSQQPLGISV